MCACIRHKRFNCFWWQVIDHFHVSWLFFAFAFVFCYFECFCRCLDAQQLSFDYYWKIFRFSFRLKYIYDDDDLMIILLWEHNLHDLIVTFSLFLHIYKIYLYMYICVMYIVIGLSRNILHCKLNCERVNDQNGSISIPGIC